MNDYQDHPQENQGSVGWGFLLGVLLNLLQGALFWLVLSKSTSSGITLLVVGLGGWGVIQLVYIVPIYFYLRHRNKAATAKGLVIAGSIVLLINVGCWVVVRG